MKQNSTPNESSTSCDVIVNKNFSDYGTLLAIEIDQRQIDLLATQILA